MSNRRFYREYSVVSFALLYIGNIPEYLITNKMPSYQYRKSHCGDKTILWPSYLHNGISYTSKLASIYIVKIRTQVDSLTQPTTAASVAGDSPHSPSRKECCLTQRIPRPGWWCPWYDSCPRCFPRSHTLLRGPGHHADEGPGTQATRSGILRSGRTHQRRSSSQVGHWRAIIRSSSGGK